jgi:glycosyltransferase involved in cell wall biosynthesis
MSPASGSPFRDRAAHPLAGVTVLQIIPDLRPSAAARATIDIAAALSRVGATALVASQGGRMVSELQAKGGLFTPFPAQAKNPLGMAFNIRRLAQLIKSERVDLVHARSRAPAWVAFGATRLTKTPFVTSFQSSYAGGGALAARYNSIMARGDPIIADSAFTAALVAKLYPAAKDKIRIIRGGVDSRLFAPKAVAPARVQALRRNWGVAPDERVILLAAGRGASLKLLIEAVSLLAAQDLGVIKFILAGDEHGGASKEIDAAIARAGLQDIVRRGGGADRPAALLAASVVVALSTRSEPFVGLALEAQAMGTPVIVADAGAARETILAPPEVDPALRTGWIVPPGDAQALVNALLEALSLGAAAGDRLSLRARAHVETNFSIEQIWAQTLDAYLAARDAR